MKHSTKKVFSLMLIAALMACASPAHADGDNVLDKTSDWFATMGKSGSEKDMILAERRAGRVARRLSKGVEKGARKAGKSLKEMGKDLERSME